MAQPTQQQYNDCAFVLQHMAKSTEKHEPYAKVNIQHLEAVLEENSFMVEDYPE
ncbi:MAG: hypothetical protein JKX78_03550 [Alteromonadaceae bacterium]|nr:hypothetical protein [Alteromonadaceae bacterium]MBL4909093.1 hypothetical protein [Alteromonadaceae bacterium]